MTNENFIQGSCEEFCPPQEAKLRIKEKLLHFYELKNGQKNVPGLLVKCFSRSAAGIKTPKQKDLRTERCLQLTIEHLLKEVMLDKRKPYNFTYDFIFDRLRAVRQEIVMQNYNEPRTVKLLGPMIMFLAYSRYRLCEDSIGNFDTKICDQHLQECLKRVLCCYDVINCSAQNLNELRNRNFIEALYQLFNLGSIEALRRGLTLPSEIRYDATFKCAFGIALSYHQGNLYRVFDGIKRLPHLLCAIASLKIQVIRRQLYQMFAHAYSNKQLMVPVEFLCRLSLHKDKHELFADCKYYNMRISDQREHVHFQRTDFASSAEALKVKREHFVESKINCIYLPEVLLLKKL